MGAGGVGAEGVGAGGVGAGGYAATRDTIPPDSDACCAPWDIVVRPLLGLVFLAVSIPLYLITMLPVVVVLFFQGLLLVSGCLPALPPEPSKVCAHFVCDGCGWSGRYRIQVTS